MQQSMGSQTQTWRSNWTTRKKYKRQGKKRKIQKARREIYVKLTETSDHWSAQGHRCPLDTQNPYKKELELRSLKWLCRHCLPLDLWSHKAQSRAIHLCSDFCCRRHWPRRLEFPIDVDASTTSVTNKLVIYFQKSDVHTARNNSFFFFKEKINYKHALVISLNSMVSKTCDLLPCFLPAFPQGLLEAWLAHMIISEYMALKTAGKLEAHRELGRVRGERLLHLISIISHSSISGPLGSGSRT